MNLQTITKVLWVGALLSLIAAPLSLLYIDTSLLFPYITGKNFAWRFLITIGLVLWSGAALLDAKYRIDLKHPIVLALGLYLAVMLLANTLGPNPYLAFWSTIERMDGFIGLLHLAGYFVLLAGVMQNKKHMLTYLVYLLVISVGIGVMDWGGEGRIDSTLGNPIYLASVAMFGVFFSVFLFSRTLFVEYKSIIPLEKIKSEMITLSLSAATFWLSLHVGKYILGFLSFGGLLPGLGDFHVKTLILFTFLMVGFVFYRSRKEKPLLIFIAPLIASIVTIFYTGTRGALLGLVVGGLVTSLIILTFRSRDYIQFKFIAGILVALTLISTTAFFTSRESLAQIPFVQESQMLSRIMKISTEDRTTGFRLANWNMALEAAGDSPAVGYGQEGYAEVFSKYFNYSELAGAEEWYDRTHNVFLDALVFGGYPGLIAYLLLFATVLFLIISRSQFSTLEKAALIGLIAGYLAQNFVAFDSLGSGIYLYAIFGLIYLYSTKEKGEELITITPVFAAVIWLLIALSSVWWIHHSIIGPKKQIATYIDYLRATRNADPASIEEAYPLFRESVLSESFATREILLQAIRQEQKIRGEGVDSEVAAQYITTIVESAGRFNRERDTRLSLSLGTLLSNIGLTSVGKADLEQALKNSPNKPAIIIQNAIAEQRLENTEQASVLFERLETIIEDYEQNTSVEEAKIRQFKNILREFERRSGE